MKSIVFCPYFGKLPTNFNLWAVSCGYNTDFQFIVFTNDEEEYTVPSNVKIIRIEFEKFKNRIQQKFDFDISLDTPYKLCDYKPTYGYVFEEYTLGFDYWGYCDLDLIFGDLNKFLPKKAYDKISNLGHLCLYRNTKEIRESFMSDSDSSIDYKDILANSIHFGFDEIGDYGINHKIKNIYPYEKYVADISCAREGMVIAEFDGKNFYPRKGIRVFSFVNGRVFSNELEKNEIVQKEYAYIHLQKRKMINEVTCDYKKFLILPNKYCNYEKITPELVINSQDRTIFPFVKIFRVKSNSWIIKNRRKRFIKQLLLKKENYFIV